MQPFEEIHPEVANQRLAGADGWALIDVRSVGEFEAGHPRGAWNIPLAIPAFGGMRPNPRFVEAVRARFAPDTPLILSCAVGGRSAIACQMLRAQGFSALHNLSGGMDGARDMAGRKLGAGWADLGLPIATDAAEGRAWAEIESALDEARSGEPQAP